MSSVFATTLQNYRGKKNSRDNEQNFNAQLVCNNLETFCTKFTIDRVTVSDTLSYSTSSKIESWKGTTESFVLN